MYKDFLCIIQITLNKYSYFWVNKAIYEIVSKLKTHLFYIVWPLLVA